MIALIGGLFSLAVFWHFVADWFPQSHQEALTKARDPEVRAVHCAKYTLAFLFPMMFIGLVNKYALLLAIGAILFGSHYVIDSYVPVLLWAKYFRRHPAFNEYVYVEVGKGEYHKITDEEAFKKMTSTTLGLILIITMDQLMHIAALLPVAVLLALYAF